jgi:diguanylate cyclase (GGDEF)-like protein
MWKYFSEFMQQYKDARCQEDDIRRMILIYMGMSIGCAVLIIMAVYNNMLEKYTLVAMNCSVAGLLVFLMAHLHIKKNVRVTAVVTTMITWTFFLWLLIYGGTNNSTFVWCYTFPLYANFLIGVRRGTIASVLMCLAFIAYFLFDSNFPNLAQYTIDLKIRFALAYLVLVSFAYMSENMRVKAQAELKNVNDNFSELAIKNEKLEKVSSIDPLTGLNNRMKIDEVLDSEIKLAICSCRTMSLVIIDLDFFKEVNDTYGHLVGDKVLCEFARFLEGNVRDSDTVGRWGGEEFVVISPATSGDQGMAIAEKLRSNLTQTDFTKVGRITASFGVTEFHEDDSIDSFIKRADEALYSAKGERNTCVYGKVNK